MLSVDKMLIVPILVYDTVLNSLENSCHSIVLGVHSEMYMIFWIPSAFLLHFN